MSAKDPMGWVAPMVSFLVTPAQGSVTEIRKSQKICHRKSDNHRKWVTESQAITVIPFFISEFLIFWFFLHTALRRRNLWIFPPHVHVNLAVDFAVNSVMDFSWSFEPYNGPEKLTPKFAQEFALKFAPARGKIRTPRGPCETSWCLAAKIDSPLSRGNFWLSITLTRIVS